MKLEDEDVLLTIVAWIFLVAAVVMTVVMIGVGSAGQWDWGDENDQALVSFFLFFVAMAVVTNWARKRS
jgi:hypothetical protein